MFIYPEVSDKLILKEACIDTHEVRIKKTFELGKELGYDAVSTSLLVSPKLDHDYILSVGLKYSESFDIPFYYEAFMLEKNKDSIFESFFTFTYISFLKNAIMRNKEKTLDSIFLPRYFVI